MATIIGTEGNDTLSGTNEADTLYGLAGNDNLQGLAENDQLFGNLGNDTLDGGGENDLAYGGKDNDQIFGNGGNDTLFGDLGNDTVRGGDGDDLLFGDQSAAANFGGNGEDLLLGEAGNDTIFGLDGFDQIEGNSGNDVINGNQGNDTVSGGEGNDLINGGGDNDQIFGDLGEDTLYGDLGNDSVSGGEGRDFIYGLRGDDSLFGGSFDDEIYGNQGDDTVVGGEGNDVLYGGRNNDLVLGELGNDILSGDLGIDTLTGGEGNDIFLLRNALGGTKLAEADIITDFVNGADLLRLTEGLRFEDLNIFQGTGANAADTIIQDVINNQFLAVLRGANRNTIDRADFLIPGTLSFSAPTFQVNENGTTGAAVTIARTGGADGAVSVTVASANGSATAPADYNNTPIAIAFASGETTKTVTIPIVDDAFGEYTETINLTLVNPTGGATIGAQNTAVLEIVDNDALSSPTRTFRSPNPRADSRFGYSLATAGNNILIGAPATFSSRPGEAYLFDAATGNLLRTFRSPTPSPNDNFGNSVAAVGNNVLISAPGLARAYLFDGTNGVLLQTFSNPGAGNGFGESDRFGTSIAVVGNNILIGARSEDVGNAIDAGAAYLFDIATGRLLQTFLNPTPEPGLELFGNSVAALGNNALVWTIDRNRASQGAYLFDSNTGTLLREFFPPGTLFPYLVGNQSVATLGNNVLVGTSGDNTGLPTTSFIASGAAYLFDGVTGARLQSFFNPTPDDQDAFGNAVATVGNNVVIGALFDDTGAQDNGIAYLFNPSTGALLQTFLNPTPSIDSNFGTAIAPIGSNVLIGAPNAEVGGAVYLF